jgi:hypothetical protein
MSAPTDQLDREEKPMNANISESDAVPGPIRSFVSVISLGTAVGALAIYAIVQAPAMWRTAERFKAERIQQEDRTYCDKFRMPPGSENFATCVTYLAEIRRRHRDRLAAEAAGLF